MSFDEQRDEMLRDMIDSGVEIAGGAVGGALGFFAGGPAVAAVLGAGGAAAAVAFKRIGGELSTRLLGPREKVRLGAVIVLAASEIEARVEAGESVREDGFFEQDSTGRSGGAELVESVLLKSQREPEEKKLPFMAHLLAATAFDTGISGAMAQQLSKLAEQLSYRQLCLLRVFAVRDQLPLRSTSYRGQGDFDRETLQVLYECYDLYTRGLVSNGGEAAFGVPDLAPAGMQPQGIGAELHNLMHLSDIPSDDLTPLVLVLREPSAGA